MLAMLPLGGLVLIRPSLILLIPYGLWALFTNGEAEVGSTALAWALYALVIAGVNRARRGWFVCLYLLLWLMLAANVAGCYKVVDGYLRDWK